MHTSLATYTVHTLCAFIYVLQGHGVYVKALDAAKREAQAALQETTEVINRPPCLAYVRMYVCTCMYMSLWQVFDQGLYTMSPIRIKGTQCSMHSTATLTCDGNCYCQPKAHVSHLQYIRIAYASQTMYSTPYHEGFAIFALSYHSLIKIRSLPSFVSLGWTDLELHIRTYSYVYEGLLLSKLALTQP